MDDRRPEIIILLISSIRKAASLSRRPEIENTASGRAGRLKSEGLPEAPGWPEAQTHYF